MVKKSDLKQKLNSIWTVSEIQCSEMIWSSWEKEKDFFFPLNLLNLCQPTSPTEQLWSVLVSTAGLLAA